MRTSKLAFMPVSCPQHVIGKDGIGRDFIDREMIEKSYLFLLDEGYDVIYLKEAGIIDTCDKAWESIKYFKNEEVDCIIFYFAGWFWVTHYMQPVRWANIPIIGWSPNIARGWNFNNIGVMNGAMKEWGDLPYKPVWGLPGTEFVKNIIKSFSDAAKVKNILQKSKFGLFGGTSMGIAAGFADFNEWGEKFGIFTEHTSELVIIEEARKISVNTVNNFYKKLKSEYGFVTDLNEQMNRSIRHYLAYKRIIEDNKYDFAALKCTFDASDYYVSGCLSQALLAKDNFISTCEGDCHAALTERVFQIITDQEFFMADVQKADIENNILFLVDDGTANPNLACNNNCVELHNQWTGEAETGGICIKLTAKPGKVTLARISREGKNGYVCQLSTGMVLDNVKINHDSYCGCGFPNWPHAFVKLDGNINKFIENMNVEYIHMVYGDITDSMLEACKLLNIKIKTN